MWFMLLLSSNHMPTQSANPCGDGSVNDIEGLPKNTRVMAPLGDVLYPGIVVEPPPYEPLGAGMVRVQFIPPVRAEPPFDTIEAVTCPVTRVTAGWF
jgi:hypothetical protein